MDNQQDGRCGSREPPLSHPFGAEPASAVSGKAGIANAELLPNGPNLWRAILAQMPPGAVIAGGAVRDYLLGYEPKDIDVFMAIPPISSEPIPFPDLGEPTATLADVEFGDPRHGLLRIEVEHERFEEYTAVSNIVCVSSGTMFGRKVDAVDLDDFEGGEKLISQFDFGITRCWFDGAIHDTAEAKRDRESRCISLLRGERMERSLARFERLKGRWGGDWKLAILASAAGGRSPEPNADSAQPEGRQSGDGEASATPNRGSHNG